MTIDEPRAPRSVVVVLFDRFELLDVFGPLELFGALTDRFEIHLLGEKAGPMRSAQGPTGAWAPSPPTVSASVSSRTPRLSRTSMGTVTPT